MQLPNADLRNCPYIGYSIPRLLCWSTQAQKTNSVRRGWDGTVRLGIGLGEWWSSCCPCSRKPRYQLCDALTSLQNRRLYEISQSHRPRQEIHDNKHMLRSKVVTSYDLESTTAEHCTDEVVGGRRGRLTLCSSAGASARRTAFTLHASAYLD